MRFDPPQTEIAIHPVIARTTEQEIVSELEALFTHPARSLQDFLGTIVFGGQASLFKKPLQALPVFRTVDTSGYNFSFNKKMVAYLRFGVTTSQYFVVQAQLLGLKSGWVSHYYSADGKYAFSEGPITHTFAEHPSELMEPECPILNHIYNILAANYAESTTGRINTAQVHTLETFLRRLSKTRFQELSASKGARDGAIVAVAREMLAIEADPVYTWKERHTLIRGLRERRSRLIRTLCRAHSISRFRFVPALLMADLRDLFVRFGERPLDNTFGVLERVLIDPLRWFGGVVRNNMGYSIALAIYSPFTFFFITQPMNPHAMWAVGNVRSAYLQTADKVKHWIGLDKSVSFAEKALPAAGAAALASSESGKIVGNDSPSVVVGNMEVSSNSPSLDHLPWEDRMSNFKAMQIGYEENLEIAPRMGRLEQMETQLNWPMHIEASWLETSRYLDSLNFVLANDKDYAPQFVTFARNEKARAEQVQLYLWDKNVRFILDHPYTLMDQSHDQTQFDYYVGRAFILLRDMTLELSQHYQNLPLPAGYDSIKQLAQKFESEYKAGGSVLDRLKANSKVFAQKDPLNSDELRSYMKRQWEVLYLLQNKTQEASNNGLQMYIWSVRNTTYLLQSMYSSKREELSILAMNFKRNGIVNKLTNNLSFRRIDSQYEALYHMLVLEFASVQKEIGAALKNDLEATQRKKIIAGVESFLKERDSLLKGANLL